MVQTLEVLCRNGKGSFESGSFFLSKGFHVVEFSVNSKESDYSLRIVGSKGQTYLHLSRIDQADNRETSPFVKSSADRLTYQVEVDDETSWTLELTRVMDY